MLFCKIIKKNKNVSHAFVCIRRRINVLQIYPIIDCRWETNKFSVYVIANNNCEWVRNKKFSCNLDAPLYSEINYHNAILIGRKANINAQGNNNHRVECWKLKFIGCRISHDVMQKKEEERERKTHSLQPRSSSNKANGSFMIMMTFIDLIFFRCFLFYITTQSSLYCLIEQ